ncbi:MAG TPA: tetratricopeptide repeat protein [Planctomycetota bacterium]|nr:tetratricopeptide repeat protein [Planctomycetota bacterium]
MKRLPLLLLILLLCHASAQDTDTAAPHESELLVLEQAAAADPEDALAALDLARAYRRLGRDKQAESIYARIIAGGGGITPENRADAFNSLGFLCQSRKDYAGAIELYRKAIELRPDWSRPLLHIGTCQMDQGKLVDAEDTLKAAIKLDKADASARNALGIVYYRLKKPEAAEREYRAAAVLKPGWIAPHWNLVLLYDSQGQYRESDRCLDAILRIDPAHFGALYQRVQHLVGRRDYGMAESYARKLVSLHAGSAESHEALGMVLWSREKMEAAEESFRRAMKADPNYAGGCLGMGHVRYHQRRFGEAEEFYRRAIELDPALDDPKLGYESARRAREREKTGGGCSAAPAFAQASPLGLLPYLAVILTALFVRRRV